MIEDTHLAEGDIVPSERAFSVRSAADCQPLTSGIVRASTWQGLLD